MPLVRSRGEETMPHQSCDHIHSVEMSALLQRVRRHGAHSVEGLFACNKPKCHRPTCPSSIVFLMRYPAAAVSGSTTYRTASGVEWFPIWLALIPLCLG